MLVVFVS